MRRPAIAFILVTILLLGVGCVKTEVSDMTPEEASASLTLASGDVIVIRPTILGVGGKVVSWFGAQEEERQVTIDEWNPNEKARISWSIVTQVETAQSVAAREAYQQQYATSPVGIEIPDEPEPFYEEQVVSGSIASEAMASASTLRLPETWPEGDGGVTDTSLIWLSKERYDELVNTRSTSLSLGLFDESLMKVEEATSQITSVVDKFSELLDSFFDRQEEPEEEQTGDTESLLTVEADSQWGEYRLLLNGVYTDVQVVEAKNAFANYKILANAENPLILEIQLTPLSRGNLELLNSSGLAEGFGGYEVIQVDQKTGE